MSHASPTATTPAPIGTICCPSAVQAHNDLGTALTSLDSLPDLTAVDDILASIEAEMNPLHLLAPDIEITFGDENLPSGPTPSPTSTPTAQPSPTATATPVETPVSGPCAGDCDGSRQVMINEIVTLVNIALGTAGTDTCRGGDTNNNNGIEINEIVAAVNNAALGCPGQK